MTAKKKYLTKKQIKELKEILQKKLDELGGRNDDVISNMTKTEMEVHPDDIDQAADESSRMLSMRIHDREQKLIGKIRSTLAKVESPEYGYCQSCGEPIGFERLKARPVADLCIECKLEFEARERRERDISRLTGLNK